MFKGYRDRKEAEKYAPRQGELQQEGALQYLFMLPLEDGGVVPVAYTHTFDEQGKTKPLGQEDFTKQWLSKEKSLVEFVANENKIDPSLLYGLIPDAPLPQEQVTLLQGGVETTGLSSVDKAPRPSTSIKPTYMAGNTYEGVAPPIPVVTGYEASTLPTGPIGYEETKAQAEAQKKAAQPQPNLFHISKENIDKSKDVVAASDTVAENNYKATEIEDMDISATAAIASHLLATNFASRGLDNMSSLSDDNVGEIIDGYYKLNGIALEPAQIQGMVKKVRAYTPETYFPPSKNFDKKALSLLDRVDTQMLRGSSLYHETWWQYRNDRIGEFTSSKKYNVNSDVAKAIEFYQKPEAHMNTALLESEEEAYWLWVQDTQDKGIVGKEDNSYDYDYRGYWQKYIKDNKMEPVLEPGMHFPDEFKKPNHPTFSKESKWSRGAWEEYAGTWDGETYTPGRVIYPRAQQDAAQQYMREYSVTPEELMFSYGAVKAKEKGAVVDANIEGEPTGFAVDLADEAGISRDKNVIKYATFTVTDKETSEALNVIYGTPVVATGGQISNQIYEDVKKLNRKQKLEYIAAKAPAYVLANWVEFKNSNDVFIEVPGDNPITKGEVFNYLVDNFDETPDEMMLYAFPATMGPLYQAREDAYNKVLQLEASEIASEQELSAAYSELFVADKLFLMKSQAMQNEFFTSGHTRIARLEDIHTVEEAIARGNVDDKAYKLIASYTRNNFNLAWGLYDQIQGTETKVTEGYGTKEKTASYTAKGYQTWAALLPDVIPGASARVYYDRVVDMDWQAIGVTRDTFNKAKAQVESYFEEVLNKQVRAKGDAFGTAVKNKFSSLIDMYTYLGFAKTEGKSFDSRFVEQEVKAFKNAFILSDKFNVVIDKDSATLAGITDATQLDAVLLYAKEEAMQAVDLGYCVLNPGKTLEAITANDGLKRTAHKIQPVLSGDTVYFVTSDEEVNHILYAKNNKGAAVPYTLSMSDLLKKKDYDAKYYGQLSKEGFALRPRGYVEELANPDMGLHPGAVCRDQRARTANNIKLLYQYGIKKSEDKQSDIRRIDDEYHAIIKDIKTKLSANPLLKSNVTDAQVEAEFARQIGSRVSSTSFYGGKYSTHSSLQSIPGMQKIIEDTINHFLSAPSSPGIRMLTGTPKKLEFLGIE